jgi:hypothetical protein
MDKFEIDGLYADLEAAQSAFDRTLKISGIGSEYAAALRVGMRDVCKSYHEYNSALNRKD